MQLISVTKPLSIYFDKSSIRADVLEAATERGIRVHQTCAAYARGLPVMATDGFLYFQSFQNWFDKYVKRALFVEAEFSDPSVYFIVGHVDLVAELTDGRIVVVDYKTPAAESRTWRAQIAAYCYLVKPVVGDACGMALMLEGDGGPAKAIYYTNTAVDFAAFVAALTAYRHFGGDK